MQNSNAVSVWKKLRVMLMVAALVFVMMSCLDEDDSNDVQPVPVSYVSIYHASPDAPGLDVLVDERRINTNPVDYTDYSGYMNFYTGERNFKLSAVNAANTFVDTTFNLVEGTAYSLFVVDRLASIETLLVTDSAAQPSEGKAMVRFINLSPDADAVDVVSDKFEDGGSFRNKNFKQGSAFTEVDADTYSFQVKAAGTDNILVSAENVSLQQGGYYTILLRGFANPPAGVTNVLSLEVL